jgi:general secretion pathway protein J
VIRREQAGFTLVELLVALLVFGMIAAGGVAILSVSVRSQAVGGAKLDDLSALNRLAAVMAGDCGEAVARPTRDGAGTLVPAFTGEPGSDRVPMLRLVRAGWSNLDAAPRPTLQKVEYRVDGGAFVRVAFPQLDGAAPLPPAVLLPRVRAATLRYRYAGAWSDRWDGAGGAPLPDAVELTLARDDGTSLTQLFLVGTGYAPAPPAANAPA